MRLKSDKEITEAMKNSSLKKERQEQLVASLRACRPQKLEELHKVWSEGLNKAELAFYHAIADIEAPSPAVETPEPVPPTAASTTPTT